MNLGFLKIRDRQILFSYKFLCNKKIEINVELKNNPLCEYQFNPRGYNENIVLLKECNMPYRIEHQEGHKNAKGEPAPWVIVNEDRNEIVGSSQTKETAEASVRARLAGEHGGFKTRKG